MSIEPTPTNKPPEESSSLSSQNSIKMEKLLPTDRKIVKAVLYSFVKAKDLAITGVCVAQDVLTGRMSNQPIETKSKWMNMGTELQIFDAIKEKVEYQYDPAFLGGINPCKNKTIRTIFEDYKDAKDPVFFPIVVSGAGFLEGTHIVSLLIKDDKIYFCDSKGWKAEDYKLGDGRTLKDVLDIAKSVFGEDHQVIENTTKYQDDCHNCGVYVGLFAYNMIVDRSSLADFVKEMRETKNPRELLKKKIPELSK